MSQPFTLGVNYWPRRKAMYWWSDFSADEVREEFTNIRELGMRLVRIFLLWEDWQPSPDRVNQEALDNLGLVCDISADLGLKLDVTFFTGHMSGPNWAPGWMLLPEKPKPDQVCQVVSGGRVVDAAYRNPFSDSLVIEAAYLLLETVVDRYKGHLGIGVWNLGNEPDLFALPASAEEGCAWVRNMTQAIKAVDPNHPVTCGLHVPSLQEDLGLRVHEVFSEVDFPVMHGYPMYSQWSHGPLDSDFVPFLCALTSALSGKATLMEEFGGCTMAPGEPSRLWEWTAYGEARQQFMASEEDYAGYIEAVLPKLVEVGALGAVLWCYADYIPELWDRPPCKESRHERFFGLVRPDGSLKPHAEIVRRFAESGPLVMPTARPVTLDVSPESFYESPLSHCQRLYRDFTA